MTPDQVFSIVNAVAFFSWIYLIAAARWTPRVFLWIRFGFPVVMAFVYIGCLIAGEPVEGAGFGSLEAVMALFTSPWSVTAGWIHYLVFDFFVGCWILATAKKEGIAHGWIVVPMIFTFLLGPVGLLLFLGLRWVLRRRLSAQTA